MKRRDFLSASLGAAAASVLRVPAARSATADRVRPGMPGWPSAADWAALKQSDERPRLVDAWFAASRQWPVTFHFNKGLAGAPAEAIEAARNTATNPDVLDAFALAIIASESPPAVAGLPVPDLAGGRTRRSRVQAAMAALRAAAPATGAHLNGVRLLPGRLAARVLGRKRGRIHAGALKARLELVALGVRSAA